MHRCLADQQLEQIEVLHRHHLRCILGVRRSDRMSNKQLYENCSTLSLAAQLRQRRGRWLGHLLRMGDERLAKQLLYSNLEGRRRLGHPFATMLGQYEFDVCGKGISKGALSTRQQRNPAEVAADRPTWDSLFSPSPD